MSVPETLTVALAALPETRAAVDATAPAIADDAIQLDNGAYAERVARAAAALARSTTSPRTRSARSTSPRGAA